MIDFKETTQILEMARKLTMNVRDRAIFYCSHLPYGRFVIFEESILRSFSTKSSMDRT